MREATVGELRSGKVTIRSEAVRRLDRQKNWVNNRYETQDDDGQIEVDAAPCGAGQVAGEAVNLRGAKRLQKLPRRGRSYTRDCRFDSTPIPGRRRAGG